MGWKKHIVGILILSVIIMATVFEMMGGGNMKISLWHKFIIIVLNTAVLWTANSGLSYYFLRVFPRFEQTRKRILVEVVSMIAITTVLSYTLYYFLCYLPLDVPVVEFYMTLKYSYLFTAMAVIFHESVFFFHRWKESLIASEKLMKESTQAQLESLRTQVNPHFLFNSLNTLTALIPADTKKSVEFVRKLSEVYRYLLSARSSELISISEEMKMVQSYLFLLETRFQNSLQVDIRISEEMKDRFIPPLSLQLLLENCVKHNILSKDKMLYIEVFTEGDTLTVRNNLQKKQDVEGSTGLGLSNIRKRYELLTDRIVEVQESESFFVVKIPVLDIQSYL